MSQNKHFISLICIISLLSSACKESTFHEQSKQDEILLSEFSLPKKYKLLFKGKYYPEGEISNKDDSIYVFKKDESKIELAIKYFTRNKLENVDDRIKSFTEQLYSDNNSLHIECKNVNKKLGLWFLKYTFGTEKDLMYNFYLEHNTSEYRITVKSYNFDISLKDIVFLSQQISKYPSGKNMRYGRIK